MFLISFQSIDLHIGNASTSVSHVGSALLDNWFMA